MDAEAVIKRLVQMTQEGLLEWERQLAGSGFTEGTDEIVDAFYTAEHNGHRLRAYSARYRYYFEEDRYSWDAENRLETIDESGFPLWRFPASRWTGELLQAAIYQTANVDTMFKDLMGD
jgi:hypothetical protein